MLVGFDTSDDACVYRISDELAMVQTVDFFPPVVDDPYMFGQIAAANALSDIYAMGAEPKLAMNLLCYPTCMSLTTVGEILRGGADKVMESGAVLAGGHTIQDPEPKYGLCVSGFVHPDRILANVGAQPGDKLILTKALGTGVLNTAAKADMLTAEEFAPAVASMAALNKTSGETLRDFTIHSCTDVTGFGLLGHTFEMASGSGVTIRLYSDRLPLLPKAREFAEMGILPAGAYSNMDYVKENVKFADDVARVLRDLMSDPQTSGGLLAAVPASEADELLRRMREHTPCAEIIGEVAAKGDCTIEVI